MSSPRAFSRVHLAWPILAAASAYVALSALMMAATVKLFFVISGGHPEAAWEFYWAGWSIAFAPVLLVAVVNALIHRPQPRRVSRFLAFVVAVTLVAMLFSVSIDLKWQGLLVELAFLCVATTIVARRLLKADR